MESNTSLDAAAPDEPLFESDQPAPMLAFEQVPWKWSHLAIGLAPLVLLRLVDLFVDPDGLPQFLRWSFLPLSILAAVWMGAFPVWIAWSHGARFRPPTLERLAVEAVIAPPVLFLGWIIMGTVMLLLMSITGAAEPPTPMQNLAHSGNVWLITMVAVAATIGAPLGEETFFRGMLHNKLRTHLHPALAGLIQATIFGLLHSYGWVMTIAVIMLGYGFAYIYEWRKTIAAPMIVHGLQNTAAVTIALVTTWFAGQAPVLGINGETGAVGCRLTAVTPHGGAAEAGLRVGDEIIEIETTPIQRFDQIPPAIKDAKPGDRVSVTFVRAGEAPQTVQVLLQSRKELIARQPPLVPPVPPLPPPGIKPD